MKFSWDFSCILAISAMVNICGDLVSEILYHDNKISYIDIPVKHVDMRISFFPKNLDSELIICRLQIAQKKERGRTSKTCAVVLILH
jgi:hypothetical protein